MDGRLAILFWLASLTGGDYDRGNGFKVNRFDTDGRAVASLGSVAFQDRFVSKEARVTYMFGKMGRFNPVVDVSLTTDNSAWIGLGLYQQFDFQIKDHTFFAGLSFLPGIYARGDDVDLGYPLEFRSGVELGYRAENGLQFSLSYDHRSNANLSDRGVNPGMEVLSLRISKPL